MTTRIIIMTLLGSGLLATSGCDSLSPADEAAARQAYGEAVEAAMGEQISEAWGTDAPPDTCDAGAVICRAEESLASLQCHECEKLCKGKRASGGAWRTDDILSCPDQTKETTFDLTFNVSLIEYGVVTATAATRMKLQGTATEKAALGDPIAGAVGQNPDSWTNWISMYSGTFESQGEIVVNFAAGSTTISIQDSGSITGVRRCNAIDGGEVCGGEVDKPPHGGAGQGGTDQPQTGGSSPSSPTSPTAPVPG